MDMIRKLNLNYYDTILNLENVFENKEFIDNMIILEKLIDQKIEDLI